ncbi:S-adenosyl-L-methionine-dependent methyltransferase [Trichoderma sp. SZMC 28014]
MNPPPEQVAAMVAKYPSLKKVAESGITTDDGREQNLLSFILSHPDLETMRGSPSKILAALDEFSGKHDFLINVGENKAKILYDLLNEEKPQTLVELGGYVGYSAIHFADTMRRYSKPDAQPRVFSLEMKAEFASIAEQLIELAGLSEIVTVVTGPAGESIRKLHKEGTLSNVDFLFLDHVESLYVPDFKAAEELGLLKKGAVITADNVVRPGAPEYREFVRSHPRLQSAGVKALIQPGDIDDEMEISRVIS